MMEKQQFGLLGEFLLVAGNYCALLRDENLSVYDLSERFLKIAPLLYVKAVELSMSDATEDAPEWLPTFVTEAEYALIERRVATLYGTNDYFLESMSEEMVFSDSPVTSRISTFMADVYQPLADFLALSIELPDQLADAAAVCLSFFREYWGDRLLAALRAVHLLYYNEDACLDDSFGAESHCDCGHDHNHLGHCGLDAYFEK